MGGYIVPEKGDTNQDDTPLMYSPSPLSVGGLVCLLANTKLIHQ